jgi:hypothetical protein
MTKLILRTLLKIKRHVDEMCSEVTKDYSKVMFQRRTQTGSRPGAHILVAVQVGYDARKRVSIVCQQGAR